MKTRYTLKTILIGDPYVGKSNILKRLCDDKFDDLSHSTIGIDFYSKIYNIDNIPLRFHIWDTSGQTQYRSIVEVYYKTTDIVIICYDVSNRNSFNNVRYWYNQIQGLGLDKSLIYIVGNKIDIKYAEVSIYELRDVAEELGIRYIEVSAKDNINIDELFTNICNNFLVSNLRNIKDNIINVCKTPPPIPNTRYCRLC